MTMTRVQIESQLADWALKYHLSEAEWTQDTEITTFSGRNSDGGYFIYAFAHVGDRHILENSKIVSGVEVRAAEGSRFSPQLKAKHECHAELLERLRVERAKLSPHAVEDHR